MQFIRRSDPFGSLNVGPGNRLKEFYNYLTGLDIGVLLEKPTWKAFKYYSNNSYDRNQFNELYLNLLQTCETTGHNLSPQESRHTYAHPMDRRLQYTDHDLILHLWFALPLEIKNLSENPSFIQHYLTTDLNPLGDNQVCTGLYLSYVIFRCCIDELKLTGDQRDPLRKLLAYIYQQFANE